MRKSILFVLVLSLAAFGATSKALQIYVVDVEGGNATLFVSPSGESVLIDTGNGGAAAMRDAGRIVAAMKDAGVQQIDHLITTHWHGDHFGGMAELASRVTIKEFIDHGPNIPTDKAADDFVKNTYPPLYGKGKHTVVKPGDRIPVAGLEWRIVAAGGEHITSPVPGGGKANPSCASFKPQDVDMTENAVRRQSHHIRQISRGASWRSDVEQRI
jgi:competence protein ComEC